MGLLHLWGGQGVEIEGGNQMIITIEMNGRRLELPIEDASDWKDINLFIKRLMEIWADRQDAIQAKRILREVEAGKQKMSKELKSKKVVKHD